jgi:hypothetical protein
MTHEYLVLAKSEKPKAKSEERRAKSEKRKAKSEKRKANGDFTGHWPLITGY